MALPILSVTVGPMEQNPCIMKPNTTIYGASPNMNLTVVLLMAVRLTDAYLLFIFRNMNNKNLNTKEIPVKQTKRKFLKIGWVTTLIVLSVLGFGFSSCLDDAGLDENNELNIKGVSIPSTLDIVAGGDVILTGKGFNEEDKIQLTSSNGDTHVERVSSVTDNSVIFPVSEGIISGMYKITVLRGSKSLFLGTVLLNLVADTDLPDIKGMTIKGVVYCNGAGIPGVVVSDGYEVTVTDDEGRYYLPSQKETGFVFISIPGNYEVRVEGNIPQFFKRLSSSENTVEQKDFSLFAENNEKHVVLPMADWHLANRNNDLDQFTGKVLPDVNGIIDTYKADGYKVYAITLGDLTWETFWYDTHFGLKEYIPYMNKLNCQVFNTMGNHDNDPYRTGDFSTSEKYRDIIGPTYYSFNLGKIHYVVLDAVVYLNSGGAEGKVGSRNYHERIASEQLEWLKKDLSNIKDKSTPVVIAMHTPLYKNPEIDANGNQINQIDLANGNALLDCLKNFSTVHVISGHTHINYSVEEERFLMEHNTAAVSATWWWTGRNGYANNHICTDGSPGGYGIWEINGRDMQWYYKSVGYKKDYQFRTYDLNKVRITAAEFAPNSTDSALEEYVGSYGQNNINNEVLINIWNYDNKWKIEVTENGEKLEVRRVKDLDPLHIISYEAFRLNAGKSLTGSFVTSKTSHLFKVVASAPDTSLDIKVTDRFGNVYYEKMVRPKAFNLSMN